MIEIDLSSTYLHGRLEGLPRREIFELLTSRGARLVRSPKKASAIVISHGSAVEWLSSGDRTIPAMAISENTFRRAVGKSTARASDAVSYTGSDLLRLSGLTESDLRGFILFDVLEPCHSLFSYSDLLVAREMARLRQRGLALGALVNAGHELARSGGSVTRANLEAAPWGDIQQQINGRMAHLNGQFALPLTHIEPQLEDVLAVAASAEEDEDFQEAERLYRLAAKLDPADAVPSFNLGNTLASQGREAEAIIAYERTLQKDERFAEAWFNIGCIRERQGRKEDALINYAQAAKVQPEYTDAVYNQARLLTSMERYAEALPLWDSFISRRPNDTSIAPARKHALLCRLAVRQNA